MIYYYKVDKYCNSVYEYIPPKWRTANYDLTDESDLEQLAEDIADHWFHNHDGWEMREWSSGGDVLFHITDKDGEIIASYEVVCEYEPRFSARKV